MEDSEYSLTLAEVARRLDGAGVPWAVFAGAAASVYGADRPLTDVDILVPAAQAERVADLFPEAEVRASEDGTLIALSGFDIVAGLDLMDLDYAMAQRLVRYRVRGVLVPVIPPEDNLLLKAMWGRGPGVGKHDWEDVESMMAHLPQIDWQYLRQRAETLFDEERADQAVERLEKIWRRLDKPAVHHNHAHGAKGGVPW